MDPVIDELLAQEMVVLTPRSGAFDLERIRTAFAGIGFPFQEDGDPNRYGFCVTAGSRDRFQAARRARPDDPFPFILLVDISADKVTVSPVTYDDEQKALSRQVLEWLVTAYDCDIGNQDGADMRAP